MNILDYLSPLLIALFGICFICWGIYQMKTGKMVAKRAKHAIDEPREAGLAFLVLGLNLLFYLAPFILGNTLTPYDDLGLFMNKFAILSSSALAIINTAFFATVALYGFRTRRIFAIKDAKNTKLPVQKFAKTVAVFSLLRALLFPIEKLLQILNLLPFLPVQFFAANTIVLLEFFGRPLLLIVICILYVVVYVRSRRFDKVAKKHKK